MVVPGQFLFQPAQFAVAVENELDGGALGVEDFLFHEGQGLARLEGDVAAVGLQLAADEAEQGGFAAAVAAHQADALAGEDLQVDVGQQGLAADVIDEVGDGKHGGMIPEPIRGPGRGLEVMTGDSILIPDGRLGRPAHDL